MKAKRKSSALKPIIQINTKSSLITLNIFHDNYPLHTHNKNISLQDSTYTKAYSHLKNNFSNVFPTGHEPKCLFCLIVVEENGVEGFHSAVADSLVD